MCRVWACGSHKSMLTGANHVRLDIKSTKESKAQFLIIAFSWILRRIEIKDLPKDNKFLIIEASASLQSKSTDEEFLSN